MNSAYPLQEQFDALMRVVERDCYTDEEFQQILNQLPEGSLEERYLALAHLATRVMPEPEDLVPTRLRMALLSLVREAIDVGGITPLLRECVRQIDEAQPRQQRLYARDHANRISKLDS